MPTSRNSSRAQQRLRATLARGRAQLPAHRGIAVAYSGGRDSTALLAGAHALWPGQIRALHVDHGLHPMAAAWARHCADFCAERDIAFGLLRVTVDPVPGGVEAAARTARYAALGAALQPGEVLATAHHADDQAETTLFRLLRGGGSVLGMRPLRPLRGEHAGSWLWRPLLDTPREALDACCREAGLAFVDDPGNSDGRSNTRARLRRLLPELEAVVPGAGVALRRHAAHCADEATLRATQIGPELAARLRDGVLDARGLLAWSVPRRRALLRAWLGALGARLPGDDWLARCEAEVLGAAPSAQPALALDGARVRRFDQRLWLLPELPPVPEHWEQGWDTAENLALPAAAGWLQRIAGPKQPLTVRFARSAEALALREGAHRQRLKPYFQSARVPPWERARTPVLLRNGRPVQLGNLPLVGARDELGGARIAWQHGGWHRRQSLP